MPNTSCYDLFPGSCINHVLFIKESIEENPEVTSTGRRTKCHTIDCAHNTFLLLQKHLTSGIELILIGWKVVPNEEHGQCDRRIASQPLANVTTFRHKSSESARHNFTMWALSCATFPGLLWSEVVPRAF